MEWADIDIVGASSKSNYEALFKHTIKDKDYIDIQKNVALLELPDSFEEYLKGKKKQALRTNMNKAKKSEYYCEYFSGNEYIDDIMDINRSSEQRGGREMEKRYTDRSMVRDFLNTNPLMFGAFSKEGKLIAYIQLLRVNKMLVINKILGHADYLENGLMYFIVSELIKTIIEGKNEASHIMYAHFLVGRSHAGYTYFKERCGFKGYNVRFHILKDQQAFN